MSGSRTVRALGLCSGGLDSILSALVLKDQGIDVHWVSFETPFFSAGKARKASEATGVPLTVRSITPVYMEMMRTPAVKFGKNMNPCMDCHALMFRLAGDMMTAHGCHEPASTCVPRREEVKPAIDPPLPPCFLGVYEDPG